MVYIIFNTRNAVYALSKKLTSVGCDHSVVNTPKNMGRSCSLSIKMTVDSYKRYKSVVDTAMEDVYAVKKL